MASKTKIMISTMLLLTFCLFTFTNMQAQSHSDPEPYVKFYLWNPTAGSNLFIPQPLGTSVPVFLYIDSPDAWHDTAQGIVGVTASLQVDPNVVTVITAAQMPDNDFNGRPDSFLGMYAASQGTNVLWVAGNIDAASGTIIEAAEAISGFTALGKGAGGGPAPLFLFVIQTKSGVDHATAYSPLTLFDCFYTTPDGTKHPVDIVEGGHYGEPPATYDLTIAVDGVGGTTQPVPGVYTHAEGTAVTVTAIPDGVYVFDHWTLDGVDVGSANPYTVTMDADHALTAFFSPAAVTYDLTIAVDGVGGTTQPVPGVYPYAEGSAVTVAAIPDGGYNFDHWTLDGVDVGTANPYTVTMDADHALTAFFAEIPAVHLTIAVDGVGGTTDPFPGVYPYAEGSVVDVTAIPDGGYELDHWTLDGVDVGSANPYIVTMDADHALIAFFGTRATVISLDPSEVRDVQPGDTFLITVNVTDAPPSYAWEVYLSWDPALLDVSDIEEGDWLHRWTPNPFPPPPAFPKYTTNIAYTPLDEASLQGEILVFCTLVGNLSIDEWASGNGWLFTLSFTVNTIGQTPLNLTDTRLWDHMEAGYPAPTYYPNLDGFFTNVGVEVHDIAVTDVTFFPEEVVVGELVSISVTVENQGDFTETFDVTVYYDSTAIGTQIVTDLAPFTSTTLTFTWDTTGVAEGTYTMKAEASVVPGELDTTDNVLIDDTVTVKMISSTISISADPPKVTLGKPTTIRGYITPARAEATVTIWHKLSWEPTWNILATVVTDQDSRYSHVWSPSTEGIYELKAGWPGDEKTLPAESPVVTLEVRALVLSIKLVGEHDYLLMENVKVRLAALVKDAATMEPVSNADVTISIYDADGALWVSDTMAERLAGTGIYEWESEKTIRLLRLEKGVYLVHVTASLQGGQTASDILEFHVDPPQEPTITPQTIVVVAMGGAALIASAWYIDHRRLAQKLARA